MWSLNPTSMRQKVIEMIRSTSKDVAITLCLSLFMVTGCGFFPESSFDLAPGSRLPKWFAVPPTLTRSQVTVRMDYYIAPWGRKATFTLLGPKRDVLAKASGPLNRREPQVSGSAGKYPAYEVITIDGVTEIVEHRNVPGLCDGPRTSLGWCKVSSRGSLGRCRRA